MVEYRYDPSSGRAVLMEINGRFCGSFPLAVHCRAGFALLAYLVQGLGRAPDLCPTIERTRCRMVATEIKRLARVVMQPKRIRDPFFKVRPAFEIWRFLSDFLRPAMRYFVWAADDPVPSIIDVRNAILRR